MGLVGGARFAPCPAGRTGRDRFHDMELRRAWSHIVFLPMPTVRVLLFASYADALGTSALDVELLPTTRVRDILASVRARAGAERLPPSPLVALNESYATLDDLVTERDEVAIIPPVAGG